MEASSRDSCYTPPWANWQTQWRQAAETVVTPIPGQTDKLNGDKQQRQLLHPSLGKLTDSTETSSRDSCYTPLWANWQSQWRQAAETTPVSMFCIYLRFYVFWDSLYIPEVLCFLGLPVYTWVFMFSGTHCIYLRFPLKAWIRTNADRAQIRIRTFPAVDNQIY